MATGDTSVQVVSAPINSTTIKTAVDAALTATQISAQITIGSFNQGVAMAVVAVEGVR